MIDLFATQLNSIAHPSSLIPHPSSFILTLWSWEPSVLIGCAALVYGYLLLVQFRFELGRTLLFGLGIFFLLVALVSPLHTLGDTYLFTAHMVQHLFLLQVVPPLLLLGLPVKPLRRLLRWRVANWVESVLGFPVVAWFCGIGVLWAWHLPFLYEATLHNHAIHIVEHLSFLVAATIFWWPVMSPLPERRFSHLFTILYLVAAALASSLLGVLLTFAPSILYPSYINPVDTYGLLPLLRGNWGFNPALDQQLGGIIMWVLGGVAYLAGVLTVLGRWYSQTERDNYNKEVQTEDAVKAAPSGRGPLLSE